MCAADKNGLCICATSDGLPEVDPTEWPYVNDAAGPSKGQPRCGRKPRRASEASGEERKVNAGGGFTEGDG
jgi:hypothetical protein